MLLSGGRVYDGVEIQVRGGNYGRTNYPKQSFNVEFPSGLLFDAPDLFDYPVDEFAMQGEWVDFTKGRAHASWFVFQEQGFAPVSSHFAYVERNGDFYGLFRIGEKLDGVWRDAHGWGQSNFYKAEGGWNATNGFDQKEGEADDPILDDVRAILNGSAANRSADLYDTFDVPNIVNYLALTLLIDHNDQRSHNFYVGHDLAGTGRVSLHPWDLDWTWRKGILTCKDIVVTEPTCIGDPVFDAFWAIPEFRAAVHRRIRSMLDITLVPGVIENRHRALVEAIGNDVATMDQAKWDGFTIASQLSTFDRGIATRRDLFNGLPAVPASQTGATAVISEIQYNPVGDGPEFLEVANPGTTTVDLSGWSIDGVGLSIPFGTVIPAGGRIVFTDDDRAFRAAHPRLGVIVVEYPGGLDNSGEIIQLMDRQGRVVDVVGYDDQAPWPTEPALGMVSLELTDLSLDNAEASAWSPSATEGGTPGRGPGNTGPVDSPGTVTVLAVGAVGGENIQLIIDGQSVAGKTLAAAPNFYGATIAWEELSYTHPTSLSGAEIQVRFTNNAYVNGQDRNVRIDAIIVGGTRYESEDPTVTSNGVWRNGGLCQPGNWSSEYLHCNGSFVYMVGDTGEPPPPPPPTGSSITVLAVGAVGGENIQLIIDGQSVAGKTLAAAPNFYGATIAWEELSYTHPTNLTGAEIQVRFTNNAYVNGQDRNVRIDAIIVGGTRYESEDPTVTSNGVWRNGGLCQPGNWSSEYLHCNGSFVYRTG